MGGNSFGLRTFRLKNISVYEHLGLRTFRFTNISVKEHFGLRTFRFTNISVKEHFGLRTFRFTNISVYERPSGTNYVREQRFDCIRLQIKPETYSYEPSVTEASKPKKQIKKCWGNTTTCKSTAFFWVRDIHGACLDSCF